MVGKKVNMMALRMLLFTAALPVLGLAADGFEISWYTMDGGGAVSSTGDNFELSGTIGQPDASGAVLTGGVFELTGGFWFRVVAGDCNTDGGLNLLDHAAFRNCLNGPGGGLLLSTCACFDLNANGDIELGDFAALQTGLENP